MTAKIVLSIFALFLISACVKEKPLFSPTMVDLSTPENSLKSYWERQDAFLIIRDSLKSIYFDDISAGVKTNTKKNFAYERTIEKVDHLNNDVLIYVSEYAFKGTKDKKYARYIFKQEGNKWKFDQRQEKCHTCQGNGIISTTGKECEFCLGNKWLNIRYWW